MRFRERKISIGLGCILHPSLSSISLHNKNRLKEKYPFEFDGFLNDPAWFNPNAIFTFAGIIEYLEPNHDHNHYHNYIIVIILISISLTSNNPE